MNIDEFQSEVLSALTDITTFTRSATKKKVAKKKASKTKQKKEKKEKKGISESKKMILHSNAQHYIKDNKLLEYLCPALKGLTGDVTEVAKNLTIALVPLSISGAISVPLDPYIYAMLAFVVCKSGVDSLCKDYK